MVATALAFLSLGGAATPTEVVRQYVDAWNRHDVPALRALLIGTDHAFRASFPQDTTLSFTEPNVAIAGDQARVRIALVLHVTFTGDNVQIQDKVDLRRIGKEWKVMPVAASDPGAYVHVVQWLGSNSFEDTDQLSGDEIDASPGDATLWNVRHLASAILRYRTANAGRFMHSGSDVRTLLQPFLLNERFWLSPRPGYPGFAVNKNLLGLSAADLHDPDHTVLIYEGAGGSLSIAKHRAAAVAFASGRVQLVDAGEEHFLKWTP